MSHLSVPLTQFLLIYSNLQSPLTRLFIACVCHCSSEGFHTRRNRKRCTTLCRDVFFLPHRRIRSSSRLDF